MKIRVLDSKLLVEVEPICKLRIFALEVLAITGCKAVIMLNKDKAYIRVSRIIECT